jgi:uncharacterized membrane protein YdbT with pleckstrin-like domain
MLKLTKKKNLQEGEVIIYAPQVHWIILIRPFMSLFFSLALLFIKLIFGIYNVPPGFMKIFDVIIHYILLINIIFCGIYFLWQIMDYSNMEYYITNKRLLIKYGVFSTVIVDMPIEKIESLVYTQNFFGKLFNYGTVFVSGIGGMFPRYNTVKKPNVVRRIINEIIEKNKTITIIREKEPKPLLIKEEVMDIEYGIFVKSYPAGKTEDAAHV